MSLDAAHDIAPGLVSELRALRERGARWSEVVRLAAAREPAVWRTMLALRAAFDFDPDDLMCVGGWEPDGTGELSDDRIDELLSGAAERRNLP